MYMYVLLSLSPHACLSHEKYTHSLFSCFTNAAVDQFILHRLPTPGRRLKDMLVRDSSLQISSPYDRSFHTTCPIRHLCKITPWGKFFGRSLLDGTMFPHTIVVPNISGTFFLAQNTNFFDIKYMK